MARGYPPSQNSYNFLLVFYLTLTHLYGDCQLIFLLSD